jgi:hypothetical protein
VVYSINCEQAKLLTMASEAVSVKDDLLQMKLSSRGNVGITNGINSAYLKYLKRDSAVYVVGQLANQFSAEVDLSQSKYELGIPKFLAAIGAILEQEGCILEEPIEVLPLALLPYGEFVNQQDFVSGLKDAGSRYYFRGQKICLSFPRMSVMPEGAGFFLQVESEKGEQWLMQREAVCVLMLGHRNASFLTFRYGQLDQRQSGTSEWGFVRLVDRVVEYSSGQSRQRLTRDIYELGDEISAGHPIIRSLTRTREDRNIKSEAEQIAEAISLGREEYWNSLKRWLNDVAPRRINSLIIAGGGAFYLRREISRHLGWANLDWRIADSNNTLLKGHPDTSLQHRIGDVYSLFDAYFGSSIQAVNVA